MTRGNIIWSQTPKAGGPCFRGGRDVPALCGRSLDALVCIPELARSVFSGLKKRMQGKSRFNFRAPDEVRFAELGELTRAGVEKYRAKNWL